LSCHKTSLPVFSRRQDGTALALRALLHFPALTHLNH